MGDFYFRLYGTFDFSEVGCHSKEQISAARYLLSSARSISSKSSCLSLELMCYPATARYPLE